MSRFGLVLLCACGRLGFDNVSGDHDGNDSDGGADGVEDAFIRGDVSFTNNIAFVTDPVVVPGMLGTLSVADDACQTAAQAAGLPGTYVAWLSTTTEPAIDRIAASRGWVRADGLPFVDLPSDITANRLLSTLEVLADGTRSTSTKAVATGTRTNGTVGMNCADFTSTAGLIDHGIPRTASSEWTYIGYSWSMCGELQRLYCFGNGSNRNLEIPTQPARRAFLSTTTWGPGSGIATADAVCQADAAAASLSGASTFRALLATTTATAASRFTDGLPWMRVDGMRLADTAQDLFAGRLRVPWNVGAGGAHSTDTGSSATAWLGAPTPDVIGVDTCQDWTAANQGSTGTTVNYVRIDPVTSSYGCGTPKLLFCLEP